MKKTISFLAATLIMMSSLAGCGKKQNQTDSQLQTTDVTTQVSRTEQTTPLTTGEPTTQEPTTEEPQFFESEIKNTMDQYIYAFTIKDMNAAFKYSVYDLTGEMRDSYESAVSSAEIPDYTVEYHEFEYYHVGEFQVDDMIEYLLDVKNKEDSFSNVRLSIDPTKITDRAIVYYTITSDLGESSGYVDLVYCDNTWKIADSQTQKDDLKYLIHSNHEYDDLLSSIREGEYDNE